MKALLAGHSLPEFDHTAQNDERFGGPHGRKRGERACAVGSALVPAELGLPVEISRIAYPFVAQHLTI